MSSPSDVTVVASPTVLLPKLVFVNGSEQKVFVLDRFPFTIGRQADRNLVIPDARVSRDHAAIQSEGGDCFIVDAGSKQGTFVNGDKVERQKLSPNDRIEFGAKGGPYIVFNPSGGEPTRAQTQQPAQEVHSASRISIFSKLNQADLQELSKIVKSKDFAADTAIFFQDEPSDALFMLLKGTVKVTQRSSEGREKILDILGPGEIFGEFAMLDGHPRSATVTTLEPSELGIISQQDFRQFASTRPEVLWKVMAALCERLRKTSSGILELSSKEVPYRLLAALVQLAGNHGQIAADGSCMINIKFGVDDLAAMIGSSRDVVVRLLHRYQEEGLVEFGKKKQIIIPDPAALKRALEYASEWS